MPKEFRDFCDITEAEARYVDARVNDIETAAKRSRLTYSAITVVSLLMLSMAYNTLFAWSRSVADALEDYGRKGDSWNDEMLKEMMKRWIESLHFDVPFLGAKFSASDGGIIGGMLLLFMAMACFFAARRENHLVYYLIRDAEVGRARGPLKLYMRNQVSATQLFTHGWHDQPLGSADLIMKLESDSVRRRKEDVLLRAILLSMFYLPPLALFSVLFCDLASLTIDSPIRPGDDSLLSYLTKKCPSLSPFVCRESAAILSRLAISFLVALSVSVVMHRAYRFQKSTSELLKHTARWKATEDS